MRWVTKETNERRYRFDLFLSFSSRNRDQGRLIVAAAERLGLTIYQDEKILAVAHAFQSATNFHLKRPPAFV